MIALSRRGFLIGASSAAVAVATGTPLAASSPRDALTIEDIRRVKQWAMRYAIPEFLPGYYAMPIHPGWARVIERAAKKKPAPAVSQGGESGCG